MLSLPAVETAEVGARARLIAFAEAALTRIVAAEERCLKRALFARFKKKKTQTRVTRAASRKAAEAPLTQTRQRRARLRSSPEDVPKVEKKKRPPQAAAVTVRMPRILEHYHHFVLQDRARISASADASMGLIVAAQERCQRGLLFLQQRDLFRVLRVDFIGPIKSAAKLHSALSALTRSLDHRTAVLTADEQGSRSRLAQRKSAELAEAAATANKRQRLLHVSSEAIARAQVAVLEIDDRAAMLRGAPALKEPHPLVSPATATPCPVAAPAKDPRSKRARQARTAERDAPALKQPHPSVLPATATPCPVAAPAKDSRPRRTRQARTARAAPAKKKVAASEKPTHATATAN